MATVVRGTYDSRYIIKEIDLKEPTRGLIPPRWKMLCGRGKRARQYQRDQRLAARGEPETWIVVTTGNHVDIKYNYLG
jgi:hypothetical protein